jgi:hydroxymethylpyrimidine pyrophosphatase-like HAD family hydrolase
MIRSQKTTLVFDVDGTLANKGGLVTEATVQILASLQNVQIALLTGREFCLIEYIHNLFQKYTVDTIGYLCNHGGTFIDTSKQLVWLNQFTLNQKQYLTRCGYVDPFSMIIFPTYVNGYYFYAPVNNPQLKAKAQRFIDKFQTYNPNAVAMYTHDYPEFLTSFMNNSTNILRTSNIALWDTVTEMFHPHINPKHGFLEIFEPDTQKNIALQGLITIQDMDPENVIMIGNEPHDIEVFRLPYIQSIYVGAPDLDLPPNTVIQSSPQQMLKYLQQKFS